MAIKIQGNTVIDDSQNWAGSTIPVDKGGTGATTLSGVLIGNGTGPVTTKTNPTGDFVGTTDTQTLTNKTLTTPVLSATASGTIAGSLGYSSGNLNYGTGSAQRTVVNTNAAQTLTNKTINGNNNTITNISLSTAVTGTLPVGNGGTGATTLSGILIGNGVDPVTTKPAPTGDVVGTTDTQTLTNKTITMSGLLSVKQGTPIASGATVDLSAAGGNDVTVTHSTGNTVITSFGAASAIQAGTRLRVRASISGGTLTLTHNDTSMIIPGGANLELADGDSFDAVKISNSQAHWKVENITLASGQELNLPSFTITDGESVDINPANGDIQVWTLGANRTPTATNFKDGQSVILMIDDGDAYAITWTIVDKWFGEPPTLSTDELTGVVLFKTGGVLFGAALAEIT